MANQLPSYWGNPPQTPVSKHAPQQAPSQAPIPPQTPVQPEAEPQVQPEVQPEAQVAEPVAEQPTEPVEQPAAEPTQPEVPANPYEPEAQPVAQPEPQPAQQPQAAQYAQPLQPEPPQQPKKDPKTGRIIAISIIAGLAILIAGFAACSTIVNEALEDTGYSTYEDAWDGYDYGYNDLYGNSTTSDANSSLRTYFGLSGSSAITEEELSAIAKKIPSSMLVVGEGQKEAGVYKVGEDLPAGTYWFQNGSAHSLCYFFVLDPIEGGYNTTMVNNYYGHNLIEVKDGQVLIVDNSGTITDINNMTQTFSSPYTSGVYRVGTDVPAGTYQLSVGDGISDYSAYYVMSDLEYNDSSSYLDKNYFISDDDPGTITLEEGTYIELYNMTMTPAG